MGRLAASDDADERAKYMLNRRGLQALFHARGLLTHICPKKKANARRGRGKTVGRLRSRLVSLQGRLRKDENS